MSTGNDTAISRNLIDLPPVGSKWTHASEPGVFVIADATTDGRVIWTEEGNAREYIAPLREFLAVFSETAEHQAGESRVGTSNPYADPQDTITGAAAVIGDAAWRVNWTVGEEHAPEAQRLALQALVTCYAYTTAVAMETLRRVDPDAAERVAAHFDSDPDGLMLDIKHENAHNWEQALRSGQTIPSDAWPFTELAGHTTIRHQVAEQIAAAITDAGDRRSKHRHHERTAVARLGEVRHASYLDAAKVAREIGAKA